MKNLIKRHFEKKKLVKFMERIKTPKSPFPVGYIDYHRTEIDCLEWLISYYSNRTASSPTEYLEALLNKPLENYRDYVFEMEKFNIVPMSEPDRLKVKLRTISFLYNWIYYKKIIGF